MTGVKLRCDCGSAGERECGHDEADECSRRYGWVLTDRRILLYGRRVGYALSVWARADAHAGDAGDEDVREKQGCLGFQIRLFARFYTWAAT